MDSFDDGVPESSLPAPSRRSSSAIRSAWASTTASSCGPSMPLGRTGAPCQDCSSWVSPARRPNPPCDSHRNGLSTRLTSRPAVMLIADPTGQFGLHPPYRVGSRTWLRLPHGAGVHRRLYGLCSSSLADVLPPFPMYVALPRSKYY